MPPSRARRQLAARLAAKKKEEAPGEVGTPTDPDAADAAAVETAHHLPEEPNDIDPERELSEATGLQITGLRGSLRGAATNSKFTGLFSSDDSSSSGSEPDYDEDDAGRDETLLRAEGDFESSTATTPADGHVINARRAALGAHGPPRRPSTTEAKQRRSLIDDDEDDDEDDDDEDDGELGSAMDRNLILNEAGESPFADPEDMRGGGRMGEGDDESSSDDSDEGLVEIKARRIS